MATLVVALLAATATASAAEPARPATVWLAGDSTIAAKRPQKRPETGWGEALEPLFRQGTVIVDNRAMNGRSTRTFIEEGRWQALVDALRAGDHVLLQFGHNDASAGKPDRYTPPDDYRRNLERFVADVRAEGATPVLLTPVARRRFDASGVLQDSHGVYPAIVREVARRHDVALVDLQRSSERILREAGAEGAKRYYLWLAPGESPNYPQGLSDDTHFSPEGAIRMAAAVADDLRTSGSPLADLLAEPAVRP
jgi:lysophospholipase L1-like esterase